MHSQKIRIDFSDSAKATPDGPEEPKITNAPRLVAVLTLLDKLGACGGTLDSPMEFGRAAEATRSSFDKLMIFGERSHEVAESNGSPKYSADEQYNREHD